MSPDKSLQNLFNAALERSDAAERGRFLDEACGADTALRARVEKLLRAQEEIGAFMAQPSRMPVALDLNQTGHVAIALTEKPGDLIGRYKLLQQIGEGGCGVVYMAEQEEPVRRRVALKVIKLGMDTKQVIARFEAERQALALMDHPNIAKVLDAGATDTGRPYFVMELVRGVKITEFCDENKLSTEDRLKLFIHVCQAIQHAHQKGVIHRDIKPSNILVTINDGVPVPKVIDFGIAKATAGRLTDQTLFTAFEQFIGTPAYMSPEQAVMTSLDIDTRSDIYSLGVALYELLTGSPPFDQKELLAAGLDEMRRTIREVEPVKPSTRLTQELVATDVTRRKSNGDSRKEVSVDSSRRLQTTITLLRGDLDWIVMKCLEKDRARRYETASALAMDIRRHLENEPVVARPPSRLYEFQKTVQRHKFGFAAAAAVILALAIGLGVSMWQVVQKNRAYQRASAAEQEQNRQRRIAETKEKQSQQVAQFLKDMLASVEPSVALGRDATMLREILDKTAERVGKDLKDQPDVEAELRNTIGKTYFELGEWPKAEAMHREALHLGRVLLGSTNELAAGSLHNLGNALWRQSRFAEAETAQREALAIRRRLLGSKHTDTATALASLAGVLLDQGKFAEAETRQREALAIHIELQGNGHQDVVDSLNQLCLVLQAQRNLTEAEAAAREAIALGRRLAGNEHPSLATALLRLGTVLAAEGDYREAETVCRQAVEMRKRVLGNEHPYVSSALDWLAGVVEKQGKLAEAEVMYRECLAIREKKLPNDWQAFSVRMFLGRCLLAQSKSAEAESLFFSGYEGMKQREDQLTASIKLMRKRTLQDWVRLYEATGQAEKAAEWNKKLAQFDQAEAEK